MKKVGLDIDGVLANFPDAVIQKAKELELDFLFPDCWQNVEWWYISNDNCPKAFNAVWRHIKSDTDFWLDIQPFAFLTPIDFEVDCYITSRPIQSYHTRRWLDRYKFPESELVTVAKPLDKLEHIKARGLDLFIDDHWETVRHLRMNGVDALLYEAPYQRGHDCSDLPIIKHLSEVRKYIDGKQLLASSGLAG